MAFGMLSNIPYQKDSIKNCSGKKTTDKTKERNSTRGPQPVDNTRYSKHMSVFESGNSF